MGRKNSISRTAAFFFLKVIFINFLGPKDKIFRFAQQISENRVDSYKLCPDVRHTR